MAVATPKSASAAASQRSASTSALATPPRPLSPSQASGEVAPKAALVRVGVRVRVRARVRARVKARVGVRGLELGLGFEC